MQHLRLAVVFGLALLLIGVPAVTQATSSSPSSPPSSGTTDKSKTSPAASPSTTSPSSTSGTTGQASASAPMSKEECKNNGWQKFGFKTEAACTAAVK